MIGSELYAGLLERAVADVGRLGPTWDILRGHEDDPRFSVLGLRLLGGVNRLMLTGREPALADAYDTGNAPAAWDRFHDVLRRNADELRDSLDLPVQTNEVGRCAALLFGFAEVATETGLPLRLLEVGASAGLNLRWDRYRYRASGFSWGPKDSTVELKFELEGKSPPSLPASIEIASRQGCDASPIDPVTTAGRLTLLTYIWPIKSSESPACRAPWWSRAKSRSRSSASPPPPGLGGCWSSPHRPRPPCSTTRSSAST